MSKKAKRRLIWMACLAVGLLAFAVFLSQTKYTTLSAKYRENKRAFDSASIQLEAMLAEGEAGETEPYIELWLSDGEITSLVVRRQDREPEEFPGLAESVAPLMEAGVRQIEVYDFTYGDGDTASPCEVWYYAPAGSLIYSASGNLTYSYDPSNPDWGGYRFYHKRLNKNWFVMVGRYDSDSAYWKY